MRPGGGPSGGPRRVGIAEAEHLEAVARRWRARDYRYGGGCCHAGVLDHLSWGHMLLGAQASDRVTTRLRVAVADLHNLAGWVCFDSGQVADAHTHFQHALTLARHSHHHALLANIYYRIGRVHLHHHTPAEALTQFHQALRCSTRAAALSPPPTASPIPGWAAFFDDTDLSAMFGTELAQTVHPRHTSAAVPALAHAATGNPDDMARSKSFTLIALATCHLLDGDPDHAATIGTEAIELATTLTSTRSADRMRPLQRQADQRCDNADAWQQSDLIATFAAASPRRRGRRHAYR